MTTTTKTVLIWVLILAAAAGLYHFVDRQGPRAEIFSLTEFLDRVERGEVADVVIHGSSVKGHLKANGEMFQSSVPDDYPALYDRLRQRHVSVTILPYDASTWTFEGSSLVLLMSIVSSAISVIVLIIVIDLSRFLKREVTRLGGGFSTI